MTKEEREFHQKKCMAFESGRKKTTWKKKGDKGAERGEPFKRRGLVLYRKRNTMSMDKEGKKFSLKGKFGTTCMTGRGLITYRSKHL